MSVCCSASDNLLREQFLADGYALNLGRGLEAVIEHELNIRVECACFVRRCIDVETYVAACCDGRAGNLFHNLVAHNELGHIVGACFCLAELVGGCHGHSQCAVNDACLGDYCCDVNVVCHVNLLETEDVVQINRLVVSCLESDVPLSGRDAVDGVALECFAVLRCCLVRELVLFGGAFLCAQRAQQCPLLAVGRVVNLQFSVR